jgi:hypothetical protein
MQKERLRKGQANIRDVRLEHDLTMCGVQCGRMEEDESLDESGKEAQCSGNYLTVRCLVEVWKDEPSIMARNV